MLRLRRYERLSVQNRRFRSNWGRLIQNFRWRGSPPTNHFFSQKTRLNALSYGIKISSDFSSVLSQYTRLTDRQTYRQTDRILIARPRLHFMQRGNKTLKFWAKLLQKSFSYFTCSHCLAAGLLESTDILFLRSSYLGNPD